jgi:hypothetical protein
MCYPNCSLSGHLRWHNLHQQRRRRKLLDDKTPPGAAGFFFAPEAAGSGVKPIESGGGKCGIIVTVETKERYENTKDSFYINKGEGIMSGKRFAALSFTVALVLGLLPPGVQATPPMGSEASSFGISHDVGADSDRVYAVALGNLDNHGGQGLDDPRRVWAIESGVLAHDNQSPDNQRSSAATAGSAIMPETISAGGSHTCGLKTDGSVTCWGQNDYGQSTPPAHAAGDFAQVSAGYWHTCGLKTDGTLACWGLNSDGQSTPPASGLISLPIILKNY